MAVEGIHLVEESDKAFFETLDERKGEYLEIMQEFLRQKTES
ncbi:hypothetical protein [Paenibacillus amylolyticus]